MKMIFTLSVVFSAVVSVSAQGVSTDSIGSRQLNEVTVKGEKPQIKGRDGMMIVDLPAIVRDKPVSNILEALGYLPGVVNDNGASD